jgi:hypothetical protein
MLSSGSAVGNRITDMLSFTRRTILNTCWCSGIHFWSRASCVVMKIVRVLATRWPHCRGLPLLLFIVSFVLPLCHCDSLISYIFLCWTVLQSASLYKHAAFFTVDEKWGVNGGHKGKRGVYICLPSCINLWLRSRTLSTASKINSRSIPGTKTRRGETCRPATLVFCGHGWMHWDSKLERDNELRCLRQGEGQPARITSSHEWLWVMFVCLFV